ncbi:hypothetical protein BSFA1_30920 [Burkholderia sp. SFA1]|nr:hypothetical protein BSFA1_30920 [Burkholderia sp. SFA1]
MPPKAQSDLDRARSDELVRKGRWFSTKEFRHSATRCRGVCEGNQWDTNALAYPIDPSAAKQAGA